MADKRRWRDDSDENFDDDFDEYPDDHSDDSTETVPCPECGAQVYEDAPQCPRCGNYITHDTRVWTGRPLWWIILGILGVLATILVLIRYAN